MAAFLRGVNVGGKNRIPMPELKAVFEGLGHSHVSTYISSGNVLFLAAEASGQIACEAEVAIAQQFKCSTPVVVRTLEELKGALAAVPFTGTDPARTQIGLCASAPRGSVDPSRSPQDEIRVVGTCVYLHSPRGIAKSKFTSAYLDKALGTVVTFRNLRTMRELLVRLERLTALR